MFGVWGGFRRSKKYVEECLTIQEVAAKLLYSAASLASYLGVGGVIRRLRTF
jgi:hypothetical protein